jgi:predicted negative regulator of RcsB-dependent stress response
MRVLEREAELGVLGGVVEQAARRQGSVALVEGPAGIGKTVLLRATRSAAAEQGFRVLVATASPFDRAFPFGLVHQLLGGELAGAEGERRERLLAGAASRAETVLVPGAAEAGDDPEYAALEGLYWLIANLAEEAPLALLVDDLHWADRPSLRVLEYVGRRLEGLAVLVLGTMRPAEADAESELLSAIAGGPAVGVVRPSPLSPAAAGELVTEALGGEPEPAFAAACVAATGGNPLLLQAVARQSAERGLRGAASEAGEVSTLGAGGLRDVVQRRLESLGADTAALARVAAVLGERYPLVDLGEVAGLAQEATLDAGDRLAGAELLVPGAWSFVHPVMREAVTESIPPAERARLHRLAAERLRADGARADEVAVHLLHVPPARDETVVTTLREAAATAAAEGAPEAAVAHLRRALAEPPAERAQVLLELGELEARTGERDPAVEHLTAALEVGLAGDDVARARAARGALIVHGDPIRALREFERAVEEATDPALRLRLESLQLESLAFHADLADRRSAVLADARSSEDPSIVMTAHLAYESSYSGARADETVGLAVRAMADSALLRVLGPGNSTFNLLVHAVRYAERPDLSRAWLEEGGDGRPPNRGTLGCGLPRARVGLLAPQLRFGRGRARAGAARP